MAWIVVCIVLRDCEGPFEVTLNVRWPFSSSIIYKGPDFLYYKCAAEYSVMRKNTTFRKVGENSGWSGCHRSIVLRDPDFGVCCQDYAGPAYCFMDMMGTAWDVQEDIDGQSIYNAYGNHYTCEIREELNHL
jgi:hypothetical protein